MAKILVSDKKGFPKFIADSWREAIRWAEKFLPNGYKAEKLNQK